MFLTQPIPIHNSYFSKGQMETSMTQIITVYHSFARSGNFKMRSKSTTYGFTNMFSPGCHFQIIFRSISPMTKNLFHPTFKFFLRLIPILAQVIGLDRLYVSKSNK